ncbi:MAG: hypothetical protein ACHQ4H_06445 [Ktedonobacterales bacterium]|jgi:hypothetical protein
MSHVIHLSNEAYEQLARIAAESDTSPDTFAEGLILIAAKGPDREHHYFTLDNWFRHLGMSKGDIAEAAAEVDTEAAADTEA